VSIRLRKIVATVIENNGQNICLGDVQFPCLARKGEICIKIIYQGVIQSHCNDGNQIINYKVEILPQMSSISRHAQAEAREVLNNASKNAPHAHSSRYTSVI
jgi:hypothetical protein